MAIREAVSVAIQWVKLPAHNVTVQEKEQMIRGHHQAVHHQAVMNRQAVTHRQVLAATAEKMSC